LLALIVNTATSAGQLLAAWMIYRWRFYVPAKTRIRLVPMLRAAYPFAIAAVLAAVQSRLNIILLERAADASEIGYYAAALRFVEAGRLLPFAFFDALFPLLASLAEVPAQLERVFRQTLVALLGFGLLFGVGFAIAGDWLIALVFGTEFAPAADVLQVAAWILLPLLLKGGRTLYWYVQRREGYVNAITLLAIFIQVALALWLIPQIGAKGAALASLLTETVAFLLLWFAPYLRLRT
ncbi:MAG: oligosaccharide flippase family protein, partial [Anaerolineae bacterium]|nr:oligosaccharide flippase family protein [Anaerolineae bacterium]